MTVTVHANHDVWALSTIRRIRGRPIIARRLTPVRPPALSGRRLDGLYPQSYRLFPVATVR